MAGAFPLAPWLMRMPVMYVRIVRVAVHERLVRVKVRVGFGAVPGVVRVLVVLVMHVRVPMFHELMRVLMDMGFRHMQPHARNHQCACDHELPRN